jgi:hypothetical protein
LEMWQGSENVHATQKESHTQNKQLTAVWYISDTEEMVKASWPLFHHDSAAVFILSAGSPLPQALSAKDLIGGWTEIFNVGHSRWINRHPVENNEESTPECILDSEIRLNLQRSLDKPNGSEDDCAADIESD